MGVCEMNLCEMGLGALKRLFFSKQVREYVIEGVSSGWGKKCLKRFQKSYIVAYCKEKRMIVEKGRLMAI